MQTLSASQSRVLRGLLTGVLGAALLGALAFALLPPGPYLPGTEQRLALALQCSMVASLTLVAGVLAVASQRFSSEAIDPLAGARPRRLEIHSRYLQNTLEQLVLFTLASTALATVLAPGETRLLFIATLLFSTGRLAFWLGYLKHPLLRIPGFNATFYTSVGMMLLTLYRLFTRTG